jgi:8-oxo-dGTP pyrophosphatase MutT (NUDIX family)
MNLPAVFSSMARSITARFSSGSSEPTSLFGKEDLTPANRALIAAAAEAALQADIAASREPYARDFTARLSDGRLVKVKGISAADPVVTDGTHFLMIKKKSGRLLHAGGMKDSQWWRGVETPAKTALRELREEAGYVVPTDARIRVMGSPRVNPSDIRFYHPQYDEDGKLAAAYGLKPGDAFIMDSVGVEIRVDTDLSMLDIVPKRLLASFEREWQARGRLVQAGSDALAVDIVNAEDAALMMLQGHIGLMEHYRMLHEALPALVPPPEDLADFGAAHPARSLIPILDQTVMSTYVGRHPRAVSVVKQGLVPIVIPDPARLQTLADGREILGVGYVNNRGVEKVTKGEPYAAAVNPALVGTGPAAEVMFNANVLANGAAMEKNYDVSRSYTYGEARQSGQTVQGDPSAVGHLLGNRVFLHVRKANGGEERIPLAASDVSVAWYAANAGNQRQIMRVPEGHRALFPKPDWGTVERLEAPGAVVANGPADGYRDEAGLDSRVSLLTRVGDDARVPDLADRGQIPALSSVDIARLAYSAAQLRALPETQPADQPPAVTKTLIRDGTAKLSISDKQAVGNWLNLIGAQDFAAEMGLNPAAAARRSAPRVGPAP